MLKDILFLPIDLFDNYLEDIKSPATIKRVYKNIIITNLIFIILSIITHKHKIAFFYSIGNLVYILLLLKQPNECHERAFHSIWKKYKDVDYDTIKHASYKLITTNPFKYAKRKQQSDDIDDNSIVLDDFNLSENETLIDDIDDIDDIDNTDGIDTKSCEQHPTLTPTPQASNQTPQTSQTPLKISNNFGGQCTNQNYQKPSQTGENLASIPTTPSSPSIPITPSPTPSSQSFTPTQPFNSSQPFNPTQTFNQTQPFSQTQPFNPLQQSSGQNNFSIPTDQNNFNRVGSISPINNFVQAGGQLSQQNLTRTFQNMTEQDTPENEE